MSPQAGFLLQTEILPRLISAIPQAVSFIGSEDAQELVQDGTLIAARMIHNAEQAGKQVVRNPGVGRQGARKVRTISAGNVVFYTIQTLKCGRRSTVSSTVDVYGSGTQINGVTRLTSLDEAAPMTRLDDIGEPLLLHVVLSRDEEDPGTKASRKMDWDSDLRTLRLKGEHGEQGAIPPIRAEGTCAALTWGRLPPAQILLRQTCSSERAASRNTNCRPLPSGHTGWVSLTPFNTCSQTRRSAPP